MDNYTKYTPRFTLGNKTDKHFVSQKHNRILNENLMRFTRIKSRMATMNRKYLLHFEIFKN